VDLPTMVIYAKAGPYLAWRCRDTVVHGARSVVSRIAGDETWERLRRSFQHVLDGWQSAGELGLRAGVAQRLRRGLAVIGRKKEFVFAVTREEVREAVPAPAPGEHCSFHSGEPRDLLKWNGSSGDVRRRIAAAVQKVTGPMGKEGMLHTVLVDDCLAGWGWTRWAPEAEAAPETPAAFPFGPGTVHVCDCYVLPEYRGRRLTEALLSHMLAAEFAAGAERAFLITDNLKETPRESVEGSGFRLVLIQEEWRLFRWRRCRRSWPGGAEAPAGAEKESSPRRQAAGSWGGR
jgi:ribosomal protein S18 acetylase RimI-like enzyme